MRLRSLGLWSALMLTGWLPCLGQQSTDAPTLDRPTRADGEEQSRATLDDVAIVPRPASILLRPKNGVQHPDLDKAWDEYDAAVREAAKGIRAAVAKHFKAAAGVGDLKLTQTWKATAEAFEKHGTLPREYAEDIQAAIADLRRAESAIEKAYEETVKALTKGSLTEPLMLDKAEKILVEWKSLAAGQSIYLSDLAARNVQVPKDDEVNHFVQRKVTVGRVDREHGVWLHPPNNGESRVTFDVPKGFTKLIGGVAMNDSAEGQKTSVTFLLRDDRNKEIWTSRPVSGRNQVQEFSVPVDKMTSVTLVVRCPGYWDYAHAVWVEPRFIR
jgi:hypothetical protein